MQDVLEFGESAVGNRDLGNPDLRWPGVRYLRRPGGASGEGDVGRIKGGVRRSRDVQRRHVAKVDRDLRYIEHRDIAEDATARAVVVGGYEGDLTGFGRREGALFRVILQGDRPDRSRTALS